MNAKLNHKKILTEIKKISDHHINYISKNYELSFYDKTIFINLNFDKALKSILETLISTEKDSESHYSFCVLYRTVIEIFFKTLFLVSEGSKNSDNKSNEFMKTGFMETLSYFEIIKEYLSDDARIKMEDLFAGMLIDSDREVVKSFKFRHILTNLKFYKFDSNFKDKFLKDYFVLCSYVHGGYAALNSFYENDFDEPSKKEILDFTLFIFHFNRMTTFKMYTLKVNQKKPFLDVYDKLNEIKDTIIENVKIN